MRVQDIESIVRKQMLFRNEQHLFLRTNSNKDHLADSGMLVICGLCSIFVPDAEKVVVGHYDIRKKEYLAYVREFHRHRNRVSEILKHYGVSPSAPGAYKLFSNAFWHKHNETVPGEPYKSGFVLSDILSLRRDFRAFMKSQDSPFKDEDFTSFFIFNKASLSRNAIRMQFKPARYVELLDMGY